MPNSTLNRKWRIFDSVRQQKTENKQTVTFFTLSTASTCWLAAEVMSSVEPARQVSNTPRDHSFPSSPCEFVACEPKGTLTFWSRQVQSLHYRPEQPPRRHSSVQRCIRSRYGSRWNRSRASLTCSPGAHPLIHLGHPLLTCYSPALLTQCSPLSFLPG